ncbi:MAG: renalase [Bradymonadia bacterium]|jgi:renalase
MMMPVEKTIAIIGAGMAGLICARRLTDAGLDVTVFDKSRGPGGRLSTRRADGGTFDHGAQFFRARDPRLVAEVEAWQAAGAVGRWTGTFKGLAVDEPLWVGTPRMSALTRHLSGALKDLRLNTRVGSAEHTLGGWTLTDEAGQTLGTWSQLVVATPAPQAVPLLAGSPKLAEAADGAVMAPCWALMLGFDAPLNAGFEVAVIKEGPLSWIARDSSKPGRPDGERWIAHASVEWSQAHLEEERDTIVAQLRSAFAELVAHPEPTQVMAHRWRYARAIGPVGQGCLWDKAQRIGACGDWCLGPRVEAAWKSGRAMADAILG